MKYTFALLALLVSACGDGPTAPATANIAGHWTGTMSGTQTTSGSFIAAIVLDLSQAGDTVNGTYVVSGKIAFSGTITGATTMTSFSGTFTMNAPSSSGGSCSGTWAVSGNAGGPTMNWTSPGVSGNCSNLPTGITVAVQR